MARFLRISSQYFCVFPYSIYFWMQCFLLASCLGSFLFYLKDNNLSVLFVCHFISKRIFHLLCRYFAVYQKHFEFQFHFCKAINYWYLMLRFESIVNLVLVLPMNYCTSQENEDLEGTCENPRRISLANTFNPWAHFSYFPIFCHATLFQIFS